MVVVLSKTKQKKFVLVIVQKINVQPETITMLTISEQKSNTISILLTNSRDGIIGDGGDRSSSSASGFVTIFVSSFSVVDSDGVIGRVRILYALAS